MTSKQKQLVLCCFDLLTPEDVDGIWGQQSKTATRQLQQGLGITEDGNFGNVTRDAAFDRLASGEPLEFAEDISVPATGTFWDDIEHFTRDEFKCKCSKCGGFPVEPDEKLVELLENIREHFNAPVTVSSGVRCATHNKNVGGATRSQHLYGTAADIKVQGKTPKEVCAYCQTLLPNTGGIGLYKTWVHVDVRTTKARWNG